MDSIRLQKFLAQAGIASRRQSEELIKNGRVKINGQTITTLGEKIDPSTDKIELDNKAIQQPPASFVYYALNKPKGYTTTASDIHAKHTVLELVPSSPRVYPVGRLDKDTTGLLILTNDGDLTYQLTHPKFTHGKEYSVKASFSASTKIDQINNGIQKLKQGIKLEDGLTAPAKISQLAIDSENHLITFNITIHEGRKRQIRRMAAAIDLHIVELTRIRIAKLKLNNIPLGKYREITKQDII